MTAGRRFRSYMPSFCFALLAALCWSTVVPNLFAKEAQSVPKPEPMIHVMRKADLSGDQIKQQTPAAQLSYYGGPVISNIHVVVVFWGPDVSSAVTNQIGDFYQAVTNSTYLDALSEYSTSLTSVGGGSGTNQSIGRGDYGGSYTISPSVCAISPCTLADDQIRTELLSQISAGSLPVPEFDSNGHVNTIYMTYFPPGVRITLGGQSSCVAGGFCAYHGTTSETFNSKHLLYGVMPDLGAGSGCESGCGGGSEFQETTLVSSHEMSEAVTDADVGISTVFAPPLAWYDANTGDQDGGGEIGDICAAEGVQISMEGSTYTVQKEWSNLEGACVSVGAHPSLQLTAPASFTGGTALNFTVTAQNPVGASADTSFIGKVRFTSSDPQAVLPADYTFTTTDNGTQSFGATLKGSGSQTITATDMVNGAITGTATLAANTTGRAPAITSASNAVFTEGAAGSFTVMATGSPTPSLTRTGTLPSGVSFADNGNGSGTLSGTPAVGSHGSYSLTFDAHNTTSPDATQNFTLTVNAGVTSTTQVSITPSSIDFIDISPKAVARKVVTLKNTGKSALSVSNISLTQGVNGRFKLTGACTSVLSGKTCSVTVTFSAPLAETDQATLNIADNATGSPQQIPITADANRIQIGFSPTSITFTDAAVGSTHAQILTLTNIGKSSMSLQSFNSAGPNASDFSYIDNCPVTLAANASCTVNVLFLPSATGLRTGDLVVTANGGATQQSLSLSGSGK
jgi:hypothetical protein